MVNEKKAEHAKLWKDKHIVDYLRCSAGLAILYLINIQKMEEVHEQNTKKNRTTAALIPT